MFIDQGIYTITEPEDSPKKKNKLTIVKEEEEEKELRDKTMVKSKIGLDLESSSVVESSEESSNFFKNHLLFGQLKEGPVPRYKRTFELYTLIILDILFIGIGLDIFESPEDYKSSDIEHSFDYLALGGIAVFVTSLVMVALEIPMYLGRNSKTFNVISWILLAVVSVGASTWIALMTLEFCEGWSTIWLAVSVVTILFDLLIMQTIVAALKTCNWKCCKKSVEVKTDFNY